VWGTYKERIQKYQLREVSKNKYSADGPGRGPGHIILHNFPNFPSAFSVLGLHREAI